MTSTKSALPDKLADIKQRISNLEADAEQVRQKLIATGQSTVAGERYIATVRKTAEHILVTVHARGIDD